MLPDASCSSYMKNNTLLTASKQPNDSPVNGCPFGVWIVVVFPVSVS